MTWEGLRRLFSERSPAVLPVGAFEQHGPHLPLATDTIIAEALASELAKELPAVLLPPLPYGAPSRPRSGGGDLFPAPSLPLELLLGSVAAVARGALRSGCGSLIVLSWHWENASVLWDALQPLYDSQSEARALVIDNPADLLDGGDRDALFPEGFPGWESEHAGRLETALMSYLAPALVGAIERPASFTRRSFDVLPTPRDAAPANGVFFDPGDVDAEVGERCFRSISRSLLALVRNEVEG